MKIRTPEYYKDFKCIAGACTDTCCAGWDVDVDEKSYDYYKTVAGSFGQRRLWCRRRAAAVPLRCKTADARF